MAHMTKLSLSTIVYLSSINSLCSTQPKQMLGYIGQGPFTARQSYKVTPPILS